MFEASVGLSRNWDAFDAGEEVMLNTLEKMEHTPKFVLLFPTIHYKNYGGFQKLLDGVYSRLPHNVPLVGGTVAGFINPYGCFTRGVTTLAAYYENMDVCIGRGDDVKKNPKKAAEEFAKTITDGLKNSHFDDKILISLVSGAKVFKIPFIGSKRILNIPSGPHIPIFSELSTTLSQYGVARSVEFFNTAGNLLNDFYIVGGETADNNEVTENFQFWGKEVLANSVVGLAIATNLTTKLASATDAVSTGTTNIHVTQKACWNHIICKINNKPAKQELMRILNWPETFIDERLYRRIFFYPIGYKDNNGVRPHVIGAFYGNYIIFEYPIESPNIEVLSYSGTDINKSFESVIEELSKGKPFLGVGTACIASLEAIGSKVYLVWDKLKALFGNTPFVFLYMAGEDIKFPGTPPTHLNYSFNILTINPRWFK
jgi:hypothetical protein